MCITFVYTNPDAKGPNQYQTIVINNRDEKYDRPTSQAAWEDGILAGRDEKNPNDRGGTWMGVDKFGRVAILLSILEPPSSENPEAPSRGKIVNEYLESGESAINFAEKMSMHAHTFNGFHLVLLDRSSLNGNRKIDLVSYMNRHSENVPEIHEPGCYGFGNSPRDKPFHKVNYGLERFETTLAKHLENNDRVSKPALINDLLDILKCPKRHFPDAQMQSQSEQPSELLRHLSSCFVQYPDDHRYGTRSHSILLIDGDDQATFVEASMVSVPENPEDALWDTKYYEFVLEPRPSENRPCPAKNGHSPAKVDWF
uniref:Transport and Golgi organization protein 2 n=1 Tax=Plectus sambesii TaxID=2011161 RepID=A0A914WG61_9BILA